MGSDVDTVHHKSTQVKQSALKLVIIIQIQIQVCQINSKIMCSLSFLMTIESYCACDHIYICSLLLS